MENLYFFPKVTSDMLSAAGCIDYGFTYQYEIEGDLKVLKPKGKGLTKLIDPLEVWKVEDDGLKISKKIIIQNPLILKGKNGVVCSNAKLGICVVWTNKSLTQMGYILPFRESNSGENLIWEFEHTFYRGELKGDLTLETILYVKNKAELVLPDEQLLINQEGVTVGEIDITVLDFDNLYMEFPIIQTEDDDQPLWWIEFSTWDDPKCDMFSEENIRIYLNAKFDACPKVGDIIKNKEILIEILSMSYYLILKKIEEYGDIDKTKNDSSDLESNSICKIMSYFINQACSHPLAWESDEKLLKSIRINIAQMLNGDGDE